MWICLRACVNNAQNNLSLFLSSLLESSPSRPSLAAGLMFTSAGMQVVLPKNATWGILTPTDAANVLTMIKGLQDGYD